MRTEEGIARRRERDKLAKRAKYKEDPQKVIAAVKASYAKNRDAILAYKKAFDGTPERKAAKQEYNAKYIAVNREKIAARQKAHYEANKEKYRFKNLATKYGITREQYDELMTKQKGRCAICKTAFGMTRRTSPRVDHCHDSSRIRGLLCNCCNPLIGLAYDKPAILRAAIRYLQADKA